MSKVDKNTQRLDGFMNVLNRYSTSKDPTVQYRFEPEPSASDEFLSAFYEGNGLFARIIDTPAEEAVRRGFELDGISDRKIKDYCQEEYDYLDGDGVFFTAIRWARIFGGALAVMLIDDGGGLEDPLVWDNIRSIDEIRLYDRSLIQPDYNSVFSYDGKDPFEARKDRFGMPEYYSIFSKYGTFRVHESRCLIFRNGQLPEKATSKTYQFWGMPEYVRIRKAVQNAELAHAAAPKLLDRSVQAVFKMKNLADALSTEEGEKNVLDRLQSLDTTRGLLNAIAIDMEGEDYDFKQIELSGAGDIIDQSIQYLSAVTSIPQRIFRNKIKPGKLEKTTDDTSMENFYNYVERIQSTMMKSNLRYLLAIIFQAGLYQRKISEISPLDIKFRSLWSMTALEEAQNDLKRAQTQQKKAEAAKTYVDMGAITPEEVRKKLTDSREFNVETMLKKSRKVKRDPFNEKNIKQCQMYVSRFSDMVRRNCWLLLWGNVGTGKSYAAAGIANGVIQNGFSAETLTFEDLLNHSRKGDKELSTIGADLVIIDNLALLPASRSDLERIHTFLQSRHQEGKPMIFTSRLSPAQMTSAPDELGGKVFDFILTVCYPMQFTGKPRNALRVNCPAEIPQTFQT